MRVRQVSRGHRGQRLVPAVLVSALLVACGQTKQVEVTAPAAAALPRPVHTSTFQGAVAEVDRQAGALVVDVRIVWAPVLEARAHERRVVVDAGTRWDPPSGGLSQLLVGQEVQVDGEDAGDGAWRAAQVSLLDID